MLIRLLTAFKVSEPRIWSIGMCGIAVVMLLMTFSQSGSFAKNSSLTVESTHLSTAHSGGALKQAYQVVQDDVDEQSGVIAGKADFPYARIEMSIEPENAEVTDRVNHKFLQFVKQAKLARRIDNDELSASLALEAQALLFGSDELE